MATPAVVAGRILPNLPGSGAVAMPSLPVPTSDPLYSRPSVDFYSAAIPTAPGVGPPPVSAPVPQLGVQAPAALGADSWMSSMAFNLDRMANPDIAIKNGTVESIRRIDEILMYVARFFDNHTVALGPGSTGKALAQNLKSPNERLRPLYEAYKIPAGFSNRLCVGTSCLSWGGRDREGDHVLSEADFAACAPSEFDKFVAPSTWSLGPKSNASHHIETWRANATNMAMMFSAIYGVGYLEERLSCIEHLRHLHLSFPRKYPLGCARNARATLNVRWLQDLEAMTDTLRLYAKVERPTFQQLQAVGMTAVNSSGTTLFRRPSTFDMDSATSYFFRNLEKDDGRQGAT